VGKGLMFISLDVGVLDALRAELEGRGVDVKDGQWGYRLMVIADPDGNELYFPYPTSLPPAPSSRRTPGIELKAGFCPDRRLTSREQGIQSLES
jgi:hypothetical protein